MRRGTAVHNGVGQVLKMPGFVGIHLAEPVPGTVEGQPLKRGRADVSVMDTQRAVSASEPWAASAVSGPDTPRPASGRSVRRRNAERTVQLT